jgi:pectinesterase
MTRSLYINSLRFLLLALTTLLVSCLMAQTKQSKKIVVDINGRGDFKSIQAAINSLSDSASESRIIFIRKGVYKEKIYLEKHNIVLEGEDREKTIITQDIARDEWRCSHNDDWGVATINLDGNDITLKNLTVANDYGFNHKEPRTV